MPDPITLSPEERLRRYAARCDLAAEEVGALLEMMRDARADTRERAAAAVKTLADEHWERNGEVRRRPDYDGSGSLGEVAALDAALANELRDAIELVRALPVEGF